MSGIDEEFKIEIAKHMGCVTSELKGLASAVHEFKNEQKQSREHNDVAVKELQIHFDGKIADCHEDVMLILKDKHLDESQVRKEITKAIKASEKRNRMHFGLFLVAVTSVAGFIYNYFEAISNFIKLLKGN